MALTAENLITAVKRRCFWPTTNAPLTDAQILAVADEEILGTLYPTVIAAHADYYSATLDQAIVASQSKYRLPANAYGPIKDITIVDPNGVEFSVSLSDAEDVGHGLWFNRYYGQYNNGGVSFTMFFEGDFLQLRPLPNASVNSLRIRYYRQPSPLCLSAITTTVASIVSVSAKQFTIAANPASWSQSPATYLSIITQGNAHQTIVDEALISILSSLTITLANSGPSIADIAIGDYVTLQDTTPVVQLPDFMLTAAVRRIAAACLEAHGDEKAGAEFTEANRLIELAIETATPRTEGEPKVITTSNSPWRSGRIGGSWGRW